jgi:hypothetical protein
MIMPKREQKIGAGRQLCEDRTDPTDDGFCTIAGEYKLHLTFLIVRLIKRGRGVCTKSHLYDFWWRRRAKADEKCDDNQTTMTWIIIHFSSFVSLSVRSVIVDLG